MKFLTNPTRILITIGTIALTTFVASWLTFILKPYWIAMNYNAQLVSPSIWPSGDFRSPCLNNGKLIYLDKNQNEQLVFSIIDTEGKSQKVYIDYVHNGYAWCNPGRSFPGQTIAAWTEVAKDEKIVPQLNIFIIDHGDKNSKQLNKTYELPVPMSDGLFYENKLLIGFEDEKRNLELAVFDVTNNSFKSVELAIDGDLLLMNDKWIFWRKSRSLYGLNMQNTNETTHIGEFEFPDIAVSNNSLYWYDSVKKSICSFSLENKNIHTVKNLNYTAYKLSYNDGYLSWFSKQDNTKYLIYMSDKSNKTSKIELSEKANFPVISNGYVYWEETIETSFGKFIDFLHQLDVPVWEQSYVLASPDEQSYLFRKKLD